MYNICILIVHFIVKLPFLLDFFFVGTYCTSIPQRCASYMAKCVVLWTIRKMYPFRNSCALLTQYNLYKWILGILYKKKPLSLQAKRNNEQPDRKRIYNLVWKRSPWQVLKSQHSLLNYYPWRPPSDCAEVSSFNYKCINAERSVNIRHFSSSAGLALVKSRIDSLIHLALWPLTALSSVFWTHLDWDLALVLW